LTTTFENTGVNPGITSIDSDEASILKGFSQAYWMESYTLGINCSQPNETYWTLTQNINMTSQYGQVETSLFD
jgi:hypothetical protein